jgi:ribosomal protein S18 acetylase RimI-like enzyme
VADGTTAVEGRAAPGAVVRQYRADDRDGVIALWRAVFPDDPPRNEPGLFLDRKLAVDDGLVFVADDDGAVVGAVVAGYDGTRGWIYHLAADPARRGEGIGTALMRAAEAELAARGCPKVNLQVRNTNAGVIAFYEALGYSVDPATSMGLRLGG